MQSKVEADPYEQHIVNYVPDEICVLVSAAPIADPAAFYLHVRAQLNRQIGALLKVRDVEVKNAIEADLSPTLLRQRFANDRAILQPLRRPAGRTRRSTRGDDDEDDDAPEPVPFVVLPRQESGTVSLHLYYKLGRDATPPIGEMDPERLRIGLESVRELTLVLNRFALSVRQEPFANQMWSITSVSPNWLTVAFQSACGCPAGLPGSVDSKTHRWRFRFPGALGKALDAPARGDVVVAVLDTCPLQSSVDRAASHFPGNSLLTAVHADIKMNSPALVAPPALGQHLNGALPRWQWDMQSGRAHAHPEDFTIADHGLFVAGIIYDVLREGGKVHLIRVLNDHGVGDLLAITQALAELPRRLLGSDTHRPGEPRLLINLSLGIDLPIPARVLNRWLPSASQDTDILHSHLPDVSGILAQLHANLADVIAWLTARGVAVVAATGNDAMRPDVADGDPPPPRFPARYDSVLGVAATRRDVKTAADYSNRGELASTSWPGDVSTFGGNIVPPGSDNEPGTTDPTDGVVGIVSAHLLAGGAVNRSGWARWAGTSFSTPIIAAVAARLWATNPALGPLDLIAWLRTFARHPHTGASDPDAPLEVPVLEVHQS